MQRLTKAALATGGAAVLLLGGAGTMAYWTGSSEASVESKLNSGTFSLAETGACGDWLYTGDNEEVTAIVPGDEVYTDCTFALTATGDHVTIGKAIVSDDLEWTEEGDTTLATALGNPSIESFKVDATAYTLDASGIPTSGSIPITGGATISVRISVEFPYTATDNGGVHDAEFTQAAELELASLSLVIEQGNPAS